MMVIVSLDSPSCEVPCLILLSVVYRDATRQAKGLHHLKYVGALARGLVYLSRCNSGWFCHNRHPFSQGFLQVTDMLLRSCSAWSGQHRIYLLIFVFLVMKRCWWRVTLVILNNYDTALVLNNISMLCLLFVIVWLPLYVIPGARAAPCSVLTQ
jgi:hypothetical protein